MSNKTNIDITTLIPDCIEENLKSCSKEQLVF